jgi:transposase
MEIFRKMRLSGASIEDIAEKTDFSTVTIRRRLHLMGLKILAHRCDRTTPERIQAMQDLRDQGIILKHIAARFNVDKMTVWRLTEPIKK